MDTTAADQRRFACVGSKKIRFARKTVIGTCRFAILHARHLIVDSDSMFAYYSLLEQEQRQRQ
jgi:hypothetical protein